MENRQFELMLEAARSRLLRHVPEEISEKAGVRYENGAFWVRTFGRCVEVQWPDGKITPPVSKWHALTLLHYLDLADGTPLTGRTITFSQYKDGLVRGGGLDRNAELIVRRDLGVLPREELARRCETLGAELLPSNADFCARFDFAPRYPVWLKVWFADEEFPASGRLLVDESAPSYLTIEDAVTVGALILDELTGAQHWAVYTNYEKQKKASRTEHHAFVVRCGKLFLCWIIRAAAGQAREGRRRSADARGK